MHRVVFKCPGCGRKPSLSQNAISSLNTAFCCRYMSGKPGVGNAILAWNSLVVGHHATKAGVERDELLSHWQQPI